MGICDFPERIFHLIGGASDCFCVAGFEGHDGRGFGGGDGRVGGVFLGDIVVLLLELECHSGERNSETISEASLWIRLERDKLFQFFLGVKN